VATVTAGASWARGVTKSVKIHMSGNATNQELGVRSEVNTFTVAR
jgi:hypothetical protein